MTDLYFKDETQLLDPVVGGFDVTANDTTDLVYTTRYLWVGGAGNLGLQLKNGDNVVLANVASGTMVAIRAVRVFAANTSATSIVGLI